MFSFGQYGTTPLVWAARKGHLECVKHLLAMGADVDQEGAVSTRHAPGQGGEPLAPRAPWWPLSLGAGKGLPVPSRVLGERTALFLTETIFEL